jgi:tRNA-specific 2-thiouridylase
VIDGDGRVLGQHAGVHRFTIGQRRGLGVALGGSPRYVTDIDATTGTVRVGSAAEVMRSGLEAVAVNWLAPRPHRGAAVTLKIRSRGAPQAATIVEAGADHLRVAAPDALRAVTPGQAAVLYDGERVLGGGWISRTLSAVTAREAPVEAQR